MCCGEKDCFPLVVLKLFHRAVAGFYRKCCALAAEEHSLHMLFTEQYVRSHISASLLFPFPAPLQWPAQTQELICLTKGYLAQFKERDFCSYLLFPLRQQITNPFHTKKILFPSKDHAESALKKLMYTTSIRPPVSQHPLTPADKADGFARHHYLEMFYFPTISLLCTCLITLLSISVLMQESPLLTLPSPTHSHTEPCPFCLHDTEADLNNGV